MFHRLSRLAPALLLMASTASTGAAAPAARIQGEVFHCDMPGANTSARCAMALLAQVRARAERGFIETHALQATDDEVATVRAYEIAFARHDRAQRAQKLFELETRLIHMQGDMEPAERERLLHFHAVLERLATYETDVDRGFEQRPELPADTIRHWIEQAKLDAALYQRYGGSVGLRPAGPYAHFARAALVAEHLLHEPVEFADAEVEHDFHAALWAPPRLIYTGATPDFTPFWLRPLVPSYVGP